MTEQKKPEEPKVSNPHVANAIEKMKALKGLSKEERATRQAEILGELAAKVTGKKVEIKDVSNIITPMDAREIMDKDFFGAPEINKTFGIFLSSSEMPDIPFSEKELQEAKARGEQLILRVDKAPDGQPLTMEKMVALLSDRLKQKNKGKILNSIDGYKDEGFFKYDQPKFAWALVSKEVLPDSTNKNYLQQTEVIAAHLDKVYGSVKPAPVQAAIDEFKKLKVTHPVLKLMVMSSNEADWKEAAEILSNLQINQLFRRAPQEVLYDWLINIESADQRLLEKMYEWTNSRTSDGKLVFLGHFDSNGAEVRSRWPAEANDHPGVSFSRSF